jgi:hypothetical protein
MSARRDLRLRTAIPGRQCTDAARQAMHICQFVLLSRFLIHGDTASVSAWLLQDGCDELPLVGSK